MAIPKSDIVMSQPLQAAMVKLVENNVQSVGVNELLLMQTIHKKVQVLLNQPDLEQAQIDGLNAYSLALSVVINLNVIQQKVLLDYLEAVKGVLNENVG
jgi:hypothetical protein